MNGHMEEACVYGLSIPQSGGVLCADSSKAITKHWSNLKTEMQRDMSWTCLI